MADNESNNAPEQEKKGNKREKAYIIVIILLFLVVGTLGWKLYQQSKTIKYVKVERDEVNKEKKQVKQRLEKMLNKYNNLETDNDRLKKKIEEEKKKIKKLMDKIDRYQYSVGKLKEETKTLRKIMKGYVHEIDSVKRANERLEEENKTIRSELGEVETEKKELESKTQNLKKDLKTASILKTSNVNAHAIRINLLGNPKKTERASRTEKLKICFTITPNPVAEEGKRNIYLRIINPAGQVLAKNKEGGSQKFEFEGVKGQYSLKHVIDYQKQEMDLCLYWDMEGTDPKEGEYIVKIYEEDHEIGNAKMTLE